MLTLRKQQILQSFIRAQVQKRPRLDWQELTVEAIDHFAWLTEKDHWDYVVGVVTDVEAEEF